MTFDEAIEADRGTAMSMVATPDMRLIKARQATAHVMHFLRDYIREDAFDDAYSAFLRAMYEAEVEVVSRNQIALLESYRDAAVREATTKPLVMTVPSHDDD